MSPFFHCFDCSKVSESHQGQGKCTLCNSTRGRIVSDEEFCEKVDKGLILPINASTGKPIKKKKF